MTAASFPIATYRAVARGIAAFPFPGKFRDSLQGRWDDVATWIAWAGAHAHPGNRVWVHAASVGEALAAEPVIRRLQRAVDGLEVVLTHSSPSVTTWPGNFAVATRGFAPPEDPAAVAAVFDSLAPQLLVFSRSDLWPEMLLGAYHRKIPVAVIGGSVRRGSARLKWPLRGVLGDLYRRIAFVGAVTQQDAERWTAIGVPSWTTVVTGDPRHDQALEQVGRTPTSPLARWAAEGPTLIAGSVEGNDERVIIAGMQLIRRQHTEARILLVLHDPRASTVERVLALARSAGLAPEVARAGATIAGNCVIVTDQGGLTGLYPLGVMGYVGGGFRTSGLHAVIEPAACGLPIITGPEIGDSVDALALRATGGLVALPRRGAAEAMVAQWKKWTEGDSSRWNAGLAARRCLQGGAAAVTTRHLVSLLPSY